jgi:methylenetetrahydrofolate--tRNA-(uracil-5-)-methyltransferase
MQFRRREDLFFAGQLTGTEGYIGSTASGLVAGVNAARLVHGQPLVTPPATTMIGALSHYVCDAEAGSFQPMKANFGLLPGLEPPIRNKRERYAGYARRALADLETWQAKSQVEATAVC